MKMKKLGFVLALFQFATYSHGSPSLEGAYLCDNCQGYLTVKPTKPNTYKVRLVVGGGSCGGEVFAKTDAVQAVGNTLTLPWRLKNKTCKTKVVVQGARAFVSDSCIQPEEEESSTCAVLGDYTKRDSKN
jgi:hypothetical protein